MSRPPENIIAPPGHVWECAVCGKRSHDLFGNERLDLGYDVSCVLNARLVRDDSALEQTAGASESGDLCRPPAYEAAIPPKARWRPRPDPAEVDPKRRGLHPHRHPQNCLHPWVFLQHQVWTDYWGNEIEIETMDAAYVSNVIAFCEQQADRIAALVALELACRALELACRAQPLGLTPTTRYMTALPPLHGPSLEWLRETPLLVALRRRLEELMPES